MTKTRKYIIYRADWNEENGWRTFSGSRSLTQILHENFDSSSSPIPEVGDRTLDHKKEADGMTYARDGDWVIDRIESYVPDLPVGTEFTEVVICFCKYDPIDAQWVAQGKPIVSLDSFGGDREAFQNWLNTADTTNYRVVVPADSARSN